MKCERAQIEFMEWLYTTSSTDMDHEISDHLRVCGVCQEICDDMRLAFDALANELEDSEANVGALKTASAKALESSAFRAGGTNAISLPSVRRQTAMGRAGKGTRSVRRWKRASFLSSLTAICLLCVFFFSTSVEISHSSVTFRWGEEFQQANTSKPEKLVEGLQSSVDAHDQKLRELDLLMQVVVDEIESDDRELARVAMTLSRVIEDNRRQEESRWQTVSRGMHNLHLTQLTQEQILQTNYQED